MMSRNMTERFYIVKEACAKLDMVISRKAETDEFRVNYLHGAESTAYYTNNLLDAQQTAVRMYAEAKL